MIAGPGVDWFRGRGPMPDLDNLGQAIASPAVASPARKCEHHQPKQQSCGRKPVVKTPTHRPSAKSKAPTTSAPANHHSQERTVRFPTPTATPAPTPRKQANKKRTTFVKSAQIRSNSLKSRQRKAEPCAVGRTLDGSSGVATISLQGEVHVSMACGSCFYTVKFTVVSAGKLWKRKKPQKH